MTHYTHCQECGEKLQHVAIFCAICGESSCSWNCHTEHTAHHQASRLSKQNTIAEKHPTNSAARSPTASSVS